MSGFGVNVKVWASKVAPVELVGVTVTWDPFTVTLRKCSTWAADVGAFPPPQAEPVRLVALQPRAYLSAEEHVADSDSGVAPPPPVVYSVRPFRPALRW